MTEKLNHGPDKDDDNLTTHQRLDALFQESVKQASSDLTTLLNKAGLELRVVHSIQLVPKSKR